MHACVGVWVLCMNACMCGCSVCMHVCVGVWVLCVHACMCECVGACMYAWVCVLCVHACMCGCVGVVCECGKFVGHCVYTEM